MILFWIKLVLILIAIAYFIYRVARVCIMFYKSARQLGEDLSDAVRYWDRVPAKILTSELYFCSLREKWDIRFKYAYLYKGKKYDGHMLAPIAYIGHTKKDQARVMNFFKVGSTHRIYVNPRQPGSSYLVPKIESSKLFN